MTKGTLRLHKVGNQCTLQDLGRPGYMHLGVSPGGAADKYALQWANKLVGNPCTTGALEITLGGFCATFSHATDIAITGADAPVQLNGQAIHRWHCIKVPAQSELIIQPPTYGVYTYLAIRGGFQNITPVLNSQSINLREGIGPNGAHAFTSHSHLTYTDHPPNVRGRSAHWQCIPSYKETLTLHLLPYPLAKTNPEQLSHLCSSPYCLSPQVNKMGARLEGKALSLPGNSYSRSSEGVCTGTVQIPQNGQPIVLLSEHQTIGGYPTVGSIRQFDTYQLAQRRPGQYVQFHIDTLDKAQSEMASLYALFRPTQNRAKTV